MPPGWIRIPPLPPLTVPFLIPSEEPVKRKGRPKFKSPLQEKGYRPSLVAVEFGVGAMKQPKIVTGFGIRPVVRKRR